MTMPHTLPRKCRHALCNAPASAARFCEVHYLQRQERAGDAGEALSLLQTGSTLDHQPLHDKGFRAELQRLQGWWDRAIEVGRTGFDQRMLPVEEQPSVMVKCIERARQLIMADRGQLSRRRLSDDGRKIWKQFANLESGLYSDGRSRLRPL